MSNICILGYEDLTIHYQNALKRHGYLIQMPLQKNTVFDLFENSFAIHKITCLCDLLLLPGGGDIDPSFFHQPNTASRDVDFMLDNIQLDFLDAFVQARKPVIGICKGMQLINVYFGGSLQQDLCPLSLGMHAFIGHDQYHPVLPSSADVSAGWPGRFHPESPIGRRLTVNSAHHQSIDRLGQGLCILQTAPDQVIETICHKTLPILGTQWHPERLYVDGKDQLAPLIRDLLV